jgi:hypothetical protein
VVAVVVISQTSMISSSSLSNSVQNPASAFSYTYKVARQPRT